MRDRRNRHGRIADNHVADISSCSANPLERNMIAGCPTSTMGIRSTGASGRKTPNRWCCPDR
jgi:hypothetical protein